jgi:hypothetical protein
MADMADQRFDGYDHYILTGGLHGSEYSERLGTDVNANFFLPGASLPACTHPYGASELSDVATDCSLMSYDPFYDVPVSNPDPFSASAVSFGQHLAHLASDLPECVHLP